MMTDHGVQRLLFKRLSPNDNSKNQPYFDLRSEVVRIAGFDATLIPGIDALSAHRARQAEEKLGAAEYADHGFIFADEAGEPLRWDQVARTHFFGSMILLGTWCAPINLERRAMKIFRVSK